MDNPLNYIETKPRAEVYKELEHTLCSFHLKHMIEDIAKKPDTEIDLRESCLKDLSPADVCELLEEMGWRESDCLIDRHWSVITMWSHQWSFALYVSFNGYEGSLCLSAGEREQG